MNDRATLIFKRVVRIILSKERGGLPIPLRSYLLTETFAACLEEALEKTLIR